MSNPESKTYAKFEWELNLGEGLALCAGSQALDSRSKSSNCCKRPLGKEINSVTFKVNWGWYYRKAYVCFITASIVTVSLVNWGWYYRKAYMCFITASSVTVSLVNWGWYYRKAYMCFITASIVTVSLVNWGWYYRKAYMCFITASSVTVSLVNWGCQLGLVLQNGLHVFHHRLKFTVSLVNWGWYYRTAYMCFITASSVTVSLVNWGWYYRTAYMCCITASSSLSHWLTGAGITERPTCVSSPPQVSLSHDSRVSAGYLLGLH
ncbi:hypothetical protein RRG08_021234 [Elysia crispata]|uniref:Uncharacterized protein n=1 Tax=Elysia crispata TaxID=231223 RepID=A0AAE1D6N3_9GAST|nr:hypothetical protein RRG08_021234 [Elysia crispata]